jgi:hypothetical protein
MRRKHFGLIVLFVLLIMILVPVAHARQPTQLPSFQEILAELGPKPEKFGGLGLLFDIMLYVIFLLGLVTMALIPDKQLLATLLMVAVVGMAVISKIGVPRIFDQCSFVPLVLNAGMFTLPLIVAGMVRQRGGTPKALAPSALMGLLGGAYFFLFWAAVQSNPAQCLSVG